MAAGLMSSGRFRIFNTDCSTPSRESPVTKLLPSKSGRILPICRIGASGRWCLTLWPMAFFMRGSTLSAISTTSKIWLWHAWSTSFRLQAVLTRYPARSSHSSRKRRAGSVATINSSAGGRAVCAIWGVNFRTTKRSAYSKWIFRFRTALSSYPRIFNHLGTVTKP